MANYYGLTRTNYFRVKDEVAFEAMAKIAELEVIKDDEGRVGLLPGDDGSFPSFIFPTPEDTDLEEDFDAVKSISEHLAAGEVCIIISAGHEAMRYANGYAQAFDDRGKAIEITLNDIYDIAEKQFPGCSITRAEY